MKFEEFNDRWCDAFGSRLTERNGAAQFADFVEDDRRSEGLIVKVLNEFAAEYNALDRAMSPHAKNAVPTCRGFRDRYFEYVKAAHSANAKPSSCATCGGFGKVYALAPCKGDSDRQLAPEDWRTVSFARVNPFAEAYDCPVCRRDTYKSEELRQRVEARCVPERVAAGDPRNAYGCTMGGDALIREDLRRRFTPEREEWIAAHFPNSAAPLRGKVPANWREDDELEREFPLNKEA